mmetsp:Transcript_93129/g.199751  ORF Transcript_93129/g.199751 Transcript_93129/m.199751 type:complete len:484 (-) Transcript_93129:148-1599(-)|eukprot:CAMPEP_0180546322 /NCGR_PEP_ID=MMETSP1036_2-20121128/70503_1 /TAXON_ID=632150 /ORGANISM="Azadinium spinosum, Strain 3D9" /LENGTH=483 /DNA_ID=CAMNT_0022561407 /DNA_START=54 /DNA_END=1505 /DNA_ORIENTATION=-
MTFVQLLVFIFIWAGLSVAVEDAIELSDVECRASSTEEVEVADMNMIGTSQRSLLQRQFAFSQGNQEKHDAAASVQRQSTPGYGSRHVSLSDDEAPEHFAAMPRISHIETSQPDAASDGDYVNVRPHAGSGPEMVGFGIYGKSCYDLDMQAETFTIDSVMTLQWSDSRATKLLPAGQKSLTLTEEEFKGRLWLPEVAVSHYVVKGHELMSTSVIVNSSGIVSKVQRSISIIKNQYRMVSFPWDTQVLAVTIASTAFMEEDVKLVPLTEPVVSGVGDDLLEGEPFTLVSHEISEFVEIDGPLRKSRGVMRITVHRDPIRYIYSHLIPSIVLLGMSWGVFWLPLLPSFAMPRIAISCIALLSFITLTLGMDNLLPHGAPLTWSDVYDQNCVTLLFAAFSLNIFVEMVMHRLKLAELAEKMQRECGILWLMVSGATLIVIIMCRGSTQLSRPRSVEYMVVVIFGIYLVWCGRRIYTSADAGNQCAQ